ncbi:MAG: iron ABC transporter permease [Firmicutes bacterium]|nr:iron ABC transporter permease [Bacillota bacterium]
MKNSWRLQILIVFSLLSLLAAACFGSVTISVGNSLAVLAHKIFGQPLPESVPPLHVTIVWDLRLARAALAFLVGAALAISGVVMQSVLRNPLASSYTLGVSSGASLGAALIIITGYTLPILGAFTLPLAGLFTGLLTVYLAIAVASRVDRGFSGNTIVLTGMVFTLFVNAVLTLVAYFHPDRTRHILLWQMGSFALKDWTFSLVLFPIVIIGLFLLLRQSKELDMLTFGEEQAAAMGVETTRVKWILMSIAAALTGSAVAFAGVIGFIDLISPHVVRRFSGASHIWVLPMSALFGGSFMVLADVVARTVMSPTELPVGAITAILGGPFFVYVYFSKRKVA